MIHRLLFFLVTGLALISCNTENSKNSVEKYKVEILRAESQFAEMVAKEGMTKAFEYYAAEDAIIMREGKMVQGKEKIKAYIENEPFTNIKLKWVPDFVDVAKSGDLGYTYGQFFFSAIDSTGEVVSFKGSFHTIWKKQPDGTWRFVWD